VIIATAIRVSFAAEPIDTPSTARPRSLASTLLQRVVAGGGGRCSAAERRPARRPDIRSAATSRRPNGSRHPDLSSACSARQQPAESKRGRSTPKVDIESCVGSEDVVAAVVGLSRHLASTRGSLTHSLTHSMGARRRPAMRLLVRSQRTREVLRRAGSQHGAELQIALHPAPEAR
jgi:hypothetical protein